MALISIRYKPIQYFTVNDGTYIFVRCFLYSVFLDALLLSSVIYITLNSIVITLGQPLMGRTLIDA